MGIKTSIVSTEQFALVWKKFHIYNSNANKQSGPNMLYLAYRMFYKNSDLKPIILKAGGFHRKAGFF